MVLSSVFEKFDLLTQGTWSWTVNGQKTFGSSREGIDCAMSEICHIYSLHRKLLIFGLWGPGPGPYQKLLGFFREGINGLMCFKFGTFIAWVNPWGYFLNFMKMLIFWPWGSGLVP